MSERPLYVPMFESVFQALRCLDSEDAVRVLDIIHDYYFDGVEPEDESGTAVAVFLCVKPTLDKSKKLTESNRENAKKRTKKSEPKRTPAKRSESERIAANRSEILKNTISGKVDKSGPNVENPTANQSESKRTRAKKSEGAANASESQPNKYKGEGEGEGEGVKVKSVAHTRKPPRPLSKFTPPKTEEELEAMVSEAQTYGDQYLQSNGLDCSWDAWRWANHFSANGWKVSGKASMRDWKASVRTWIGNDHPELGGGAKTDGWADKYVPDVIEVDG